MNIEIKFKQSFAQKLLRWYGNNKRDLPWRRSKDPYEIWISEIMLQQTQVETVLPYYARFVELFPNIGVLAKAELSQVLKAWEGLGYYARARHLHQAAQVIVDEHKGKMPNTYNGLLKIPGIGPYTAAAIASIAFNENRAVVDGNVSRVLSRLFMSELAPAQHKSEYQNAATELLFVQDPGEFNQALMELGALICKPKSPKCLECPVQSLCAAFKTLEDPSKLPIKSIARSKPHYDVVVGIIWHNGRILIDQRPLKGLLGGLWEFPGGKMENSETLNECLHREIKEELGIQLADVEHFMTVHHEYSHFKITLHAFQCRLLKGNPRPRTAIDLRWVHPNEITQYAFPKANKKVLEALLAKKNVS